MSITQKHLSGLDNEPIKTNKKPAPQSNNPNLPQCYFNMLLIGSKGSGKTYSLVKLLKLYEKYPFYNHEGHKLNIRIIVFCPTLHSAANPVYETLKDLDEDDKTDTNTNLHDVDKNNSWMRINGSI